jgi:hypothetical protein
VTQVTVAGLDRGGCDQLARRLRTLTRHAALPVDVHVTSDALEVQRVGKLGACTLIADGRIVAQGPLHGDLELEKLLVTWAASAEVSGPGANAA